MKIEAASWCSILLSGRDFPESQVRKLVKELPKNGPKPNPPLWFRSQVRSGFFTFHYRSIS